VVGEEAQLPVCSVGDDVREIARAQVHVRIADLHAGRVILRGDREQLRLAVAPHVEHVERHVSVEKPPHVGREVPVDAVVDLAPVRVHADGLGHAHRGVVVHGDVRLKRRDALGVGARVRSRLRPDTDRERGTDEHAGKPTRAHPPHGTAG
jgi:hypothetical protein